MRGKSRIRRASAARSPQLRPAFTDVPSGAHAHPRRDSKVGIACLDAAGTDSSQAWLDPLCRASVLASQVVKACSRATTQPLGRRSAVPGRHATPVVV